MNNYSASTNDEEIRNDLALEGFSYVSQLGFLEEKFAEMLNLTFKFMSEVKREFPNREWDLIDSAEVFRNFDTDLVGFTKNGIMSGPGLEINKKMAFIDFRGYITDFADINTYTNIKKLTDIVESVFTSAGYTKENLSAPPRELDGLVLFDWLIFKHANTNHPEITWSDVSSFTIGGQEALFIDFQTDLRVTKDIYPWKDLKTKLIRQVKNFPK